MEVSLCKEIKHLQEKDVELEQMMEQMHSQQLAAAAASAVLNQSLEERLKISQDTLQLINQKIEKLEEEASLLHNTDANQVKQKC